jgi:hypothetical protein
MITMRYENGMVKQFNRAVEFWLDKEGMIYAPNQSGEKERTAAVKHWSRTALDVEFVLTVASTLKYRPATHEVWTILTGHNVYGQQFLSTWKLELLDSLRQRFGDIYGREKTWKECLAFYSKLSPDYRLFSFYETEFHIQRPSIDWLRNEVVGVERKYTQLYNELTNIEPVKNSAPYHSHSIGRLIRRNPRLWAIIKLLTKYPASPIHEVRSIVPGDYIVKRKKYNSSETLFSFYISPEQLKLTAADEHFLTLSQKVRKTHLVRRVSDSERIDLAEEMGVKWQLQAKRTQVQDIHYSEGIQHIVGGVGTGKNSLIEEELFRIFKKESLSIQAGYMLSTVSRALDAHEELTRLGIPSTVIIGTGSRSKHNSDYMMKKIKGCKSIGELDAFAETQAVASDSCLLLTKYGDRLQGLKHNTIPCQNHDIKVTCYPSHDSQEEHNESKEKRDPICPYFTSCGMMKGFRQMTRPGVWITTPFTFHQTNVPRMLTNRSTSIGEAMFDNLDLLFVDEVDETMGTFDSFCAEEITLSGDANAPLPRLQAVFSELGFNRQDKMGHQAFSSMVMGTLDTIKQIHVFNRFLQMNKPFIEGLSRNTFSLFQSASQFHSFFTWRDENEGAASLRYFLKQLDDESVNLQPISVAEKLAQCFLDLMKDIPRISSDENDTDRLEELEQSYLKFLVDQDTEWFGTISINLRRKTKDLSAYKRSWLYLVFLSHLHAFEKHIRQLVHAYPFIQEEIPFDESFVSFFGPRSSLLKLLPKPSTGVSLGYRIVKKQSHNGGYEIRATRYHGNTRLLLTEMNARMKSIKPKRALQGQQFVKIEGPSIIALSGTSVADKSPHHHLPIRVSQTLKTNSSAPAIETFLSYVPDTTEFGTLAYVSGQYNQERKRALQKITNYHLPLFENELSHHENKVEPRKVLIVVASYEDGLAVAEAMNQAHSWDKRFCCVVRPSESAEPSYPFPTILRTEIEDIPDYGYDVVIAPIDVIARGYNIVQRVPGRTHRSYFGSVCLFIRPYYNVDDPINHFILMHQKEKQYRDELLKQGFQFENYIRRLRQKTQGFMRGLAGKPLYANLLTEQELSDLCWMTFVKVQQVIGRLLRGDTSARLIICDAKMTGIRSDQNFSQEDNTELSIEGGNLNAPSLQVEISMIEVWKTNLEKQQHNSVYTSLYGPFLNSLFNIQEYQYLQLMLSNK